MQFPFVGWMRCAHVAANYRHQWCDALRGCYISSSRQVRPSFLAFLSVEAFLGPSCTKALVCPIGPHYVMLVAFGWFSARCVASNNCDVLYHVISFCVPRTELLLCPVTQVSLMQKQRHFR